VETGELLKVGKVYEFKAEKIIFQYDTKQLGEKILQTKGVKGELSRMKITVTKNCALVCQILQRGWWYKQNLERKFLNLACSDYKQTVKKISPNVDCESIAGLGIGLTLGGTEYFDADLKQDFKLLGLTHLVAVSGSQVALVTSLALFWISKSKYNRWKYLLLSLILLAVFLFFVGPEPPVLRSIVAALLSLFSLKILRRKLEAWRNLIYSAVILLWLNPFFLFSISFQLSFLASLGLICFSFLPVQKINYQSLQNLTSIFRDTVASFVFTLPIIVNLAGGVSFSALYSNVIIIPIIELLTIGNYLVLLPLAGQVVGFVTTILQAVVLNGVQFLAQFPIQIQLSNFGFLEIFWYYTFILLGLYRLKSVLNYS